MGMWKKIDNHEIIFELRPGDIITDQPVQTGNELIIERIFIDYVRVTRADGKSLVRVISGDELLNGLWWFKT
jgi:hypothetical protein